MDDADADADAENGSELITKTRAEWHAELASARNAEWAASRKLFGVKEQLRAEREAARAAERELERQREADRARRFEALERLVEVALSSPPPPPQPPPPPSEPTVRDLMNTTPDELDRLGHDETRRRLEAIWQIGKRKR